ncbi:MAG: hypothetical protein IT447_00865 [Phycisphaerales bacterium]|jgi:hypothetical protein|nr:hypothetical protein [Phycisphaerales bacterium]
MTDQVALTTFKVDVTPPVGGYLCGGLHVQSVAVGVETPLYLRGVVVSANGSRYILAGIDYCYLVGRSQRRLVEALAAGAKVSADQVSLHSNHVHDAPLIDEEAHERIERLVGERIHDEDYFSDVLKRTTEAVENALKSRPREVGGIGFASHAVSQFAGTRRVLEPDGSCKIRWSVCQDAAIRDRPEGLIDPMLNQIVFYDHQQVPMVCLNFYASHPQVSDRRRMISADTIGVAMDLFEKSHPEIFPIYFTGCAGDITAGKYTTLDRPRNRLVFGVRLYDAMQEALAKARPGPVGRVRWDQRVFEVPLSQIEQNEAHFQAIIRGEGPFGPRYLAAMKLQRLEENLMRYPYRIDLMRFGEIGILLLPSEMVVEYQLYAKSHFRGRLAVAAYGDSFLKYIATDEAFDQGGYEVDPRWTEVSKGIEAIIKPELDRVLNG